MKTIWICCGALTVLLVLLCTGIVTPPDSHEPFCQVYGPTGYSVTTCTDDAGKTTITNNQ